MYAPTILASALETGMKICVWKRSENGYFNDEVANTVILHTYIGATEGLSGEEGQGRIDSAEEDQLSQDHP